MCTCASCKATDEFAGWKEVRGRRVPDPEKGGFDRWPRGDPAGPRASAAAYAAHVAHGRSGISQGYAFKPGQAPQFPAWCCGVSPLPYPSQLVRDFIASGYPMKKTGAPSGEKDQAEIGQKRNGPSSHRGRRPAAPSKTLQHFPELDRQPETSRIYQMPKKRLSAEKKQGRGRPEIPGRRIVVKLEERHIKRALERGDGNIAAGIRKALSG